MRTNVAPAAMLLLAGWCASARAELVVNGGFENGVFLSTIDGGTNQAPVGWTPSAGYDAPGNFNSVTTLDPYDGGHALLIANDPSFPLASLSQTLPTVRGATYAVSFVVANVWPTGFLEAAVDGVAAAVITTPAGGDLGVLTFTTNFADGSTTVVTPDNRSRYVMERFEFVGAGADELTFAAQNVFSSYEIDGVSVSLVPEPAAASSVSFGCAAAWAARRRPGGRRTALRAGRGRAWSAISSIVPALDPR